MGPPQVKPTSFKAQYHNAPSTASFGKSNYYDNNWRRNARYNSDTNDSIDTRSDDHDDDDDHKDDNQQEGSRSTITPNPARSLTANATFTLCGLPASSRNLILPFVPSPPDLNPLRKRICAQFGVDSIHFMVCFHVPSESCIVQRPLSDIFYVWEYEDVNENHFCLHVHRWKKDGEGGEDDDDEDEDESGDEGDEDEEEKVEMNEDEGDESEYQERVKNAPSLRQKARAMVSAEAEAERTRRRAEAATRKQRDEHGRFVRGGETASPDTLFVGQADGAADPDAMGGDGGKHGVEDEDEMTMDRNCDAEMGDGDN